MATADEYAQWIVDNQDKANTPEFRTVAAAYRDASAREKTPVTQPSESDLSSARKQVFDELPWYKQLAVGAGKSAVDLGRGVGQLAGVIPQSEIDESQRIDDAISGWGTAGQVLGTVGQLAVPFGAGAGVARLAGAGTKLGRAGKAVADVVTKSPMTLTGAAQQAALGAGLSAVQPTTSNESRGLNMAFGAAGGAALPLAGTGYKVVRRALEPVTAPQIAAARKLVEDAGGEQALADAIARAKAAGMSMSGAPYTLGQAGKSAGLSATERARAAVNPENYQPIYQAQTEARIGALRGIAQDTEAIEAAKLSREQATADLYKTASGQNIIGGDDLLSLLRRAKPYGAITEAEKIAATEGRKFSIPVIDEPVYGATMDDIANPLPFAGYLPDDAASTVSPKTKGILPFLRERGGLNIREMADLTGERAVNRSGVQVGAFTRSGKGLDDAVVTAVEGGYLPRNALDEVDGGVQQLRDLIQGEISGNKAIPYASEDDVFRSMYGAQMQGEAPKRALHPFPDEVAPNIGPRTTVDEVVGVAMRGGDLIAIKKGIDQAITNAQGESKRALMGLKTDYMNWLGSQSPEFLQANKSFAEMSKPINQMQVGQSLMDTLVGEATKYGANPKQQAEAYFRALKNAPAMIKRETGMSMPLERVMTPKQMATLRKIGEDLARKVDAENLGRGVGSDTAQKLKRGTMASNMMAEAAKGKLGRVGEFASNLANFRVGGELDKMLQNPETAQQGYNALAELIARRAIENPTVNALRTIGIQGATQSMIGQQ